MGCRKTLLRACFVTGHDFNCAEANNKRNPALRQLSYLCRGENNAEGAGDCSPWISGKTKRASAPGPEGQQSSRLDFVGLDRLRKNPKEQAKSPKTIPQGLKPVFHYQRVTARLKSCPDASCLAWGVFPQPVKPPRYFRRYRANLLYTVERDALAAATAYVFENALRRG